MPHDAVTICAWGLYFCKAHGYVHYCYYFLVTLLLTRILSRGENIGEGAFSACDEVHDYRTSPIAFDCVCNGCGNGLICPSFTAAPCWDWRLRLSINTGFKVHCSGLGRNYVKCRTKRCVDRYPLMISATWFHIEKRRRKYADIVLLLPNQPCLYPVLGTTGTCAWMSFHFFVVISVL